MANSNMKLSSEFQIIETNYRPKFKNRHQSIFLAGSEKKAHYVDEIAK